MAQFEDISVVWGSQPDAIDAQMHKWRRAVFQDMQPEKDGSKFYFLYDPKADEESGTSGGRKGNPSILVFDGISRKFVREIPLGVRPNNEGMLKYFFLTDPVLKKFVVISEQETAGGGQLFFWHLQLTADSMNVQPGTGFSLLFGPVQCEGGDWMVVAREDAPEVILINGPGLNVWRINTNAPAPPIDNFSIGNCTLDMFADCMVERGVVYFLATMQDDLVDFRTVHVLTLEGRSMRPMPCYSDPQAGMPEPRKQIGMDTCNGVLYVSGGEVEALDGSDVRRFQDMWSLDLSNFTWRCLPARLPLALIEPRLAAVPPLNTLIAWGDCDIDTGCIAEPTHVHLLRCSIGSFGAAPPNPQAPPTYNQADAGPPAYPAAGAHASPPQNQGYPPQGQGYPPQNQGYPPQGQGYPPQGQGYPAQNQGYPPQNPGYPPQNQGYPPQNQGYQPQNQGYPPQNQAYPPQNQAYPPQNPSGSSPNPYPPQGQQAYYPPQDKKKKDCSLM